MSAARHSAWRAVLSLTIAGLLAVHQSRSGTSAVGVAYGAAIAGLLVWHVTERLLARPPWVLGAIDLLAIAVALGRLLPTPPSFYSGHAVYATYLACAPVSRTTRVMAIAVWLQVALFKVLLFRDPSTLAGGLVVGAVLAGAGWATRSVEPAK